MILCWIYQLSSMLFNVDSRIAVISFIKSLISRLYSLCLVSSCLTYISQPFPTRTSSLVNAVDTLVGFFSGGSGWASLRRSAIGVFLFRCSGFVLRAHLIELFWKGHHRFSAFGRLLVGSLWLVRSLWLLQRIGTDMRPVFPCSRSRVLSFLAASSIWNYRLGHFTLFRTRYLKASALLRRRWVGSENDGTTFVSFACTVCRRGPTRCNRWHLYSDE